jgi:SAM-dependent methyltransferase
MPISRTDLIEFNRGQDYSEEDNFTSERYVQFLRHFPKDARDVLDIGCNTGRGGQILKLQNPHLRIVGLDCVPDRLEKVPSNVFERTICGFADDIALESGSFDVIVAGEFIEHVPGGSVVASLHEMFRLLRLKGRVLLTTPNPLYIKNRLRNLSVLLDDSHVSQHTPSSLKRKLEDASFSHIRVCGSGRLTRKVGEYLPILSAYGSYLAVAEKW